MLRPETGRWEHLFDMATAIIDQANGRFPLVDNWSLGGGTALMLQINHRESFDVDIFIDDQQHLPYLNPETQGYALHVLPDAYLSDGSRSLKIIFADIGEIDFICAQALTEMPVSARAIRGRATQLETPAEIIAKKIYYRGSLMQPRDMFDIACVAAVFGDAYAIDALRPFRQESEKALLAARRMDRDFAQGIMEKLLHRANFRGLAGHAHRATVELLEKVCA